MVYGYLGPNGAGKSTTIRMLMGLSRPTSGRVRVLGQDPTDPGVRGRIGYLPGELRLDDRLTIGQTLASWGRLRGLTDTAHRDDLVQRFGIDPSRKVRGLSTGNRRKVGLVGAFMARPELLILDEPTNGLDPLMQQVFLTAVEEARDNGQSVLLSSHILSEVERVADQVAVLQGGRLAASGPTKELRRRAAQRFHIAFAEGEEVPLTGLAALDGASAVERRSPDGQEVSLAWGLARRAAGVPGGPPDHHAHRARTGPGGGVPGVLPERRPRRPGRRGRGVRSARCGRASPAVPDRAHS